MSSSASRITIQTTSLLYAPRAMRIPISRVRRATVYAITPYSPTIASSVAITPNTADSIAIMRSVTSDRSICSSTERRS